MFNRKQNIFAATLLMACTSGAWAAQSATLAVTGTIKPEACNVSFTGGDSLSYGDIKALDPNGTTGLDEKQVNLKVSCAGK